MTGTGGAEGSTEDGLVEEVARLRDEVARLRRPGVPAGRGHRRGRWRPAAAAVMIILAALLAPLSVLAVWADGQVQDTDRYLTTVAPLASDPAVQEAVAARVEDEIFRHLDLDAAVDGLVGALDDRGLPAQASATLEAVSGPLSMGVRDFVGDRIDAVVGSDEFARAWSEANRIAHQELVAALTGEGDGAVEITDGSVSVNLGPLVATVRQQLVDAGFGLADRIPEVDADFPIVQSDRLAQAQTLLGVLDGLSLLLPVSVVALIVAAVVIARDRRRAVLAAGLAVAAAMVVAGVALNLLRPFYLDARPQSSSPAAAGAVYDQLVSFIRVALRSVLVIALAMVVAAWLSARDGTGAAARTALVRGSQAARGGLAEAGYRDSRLGRTLRRFRNPVRTAVVGLAALAYLLTDRPSGRTTLVLVLVIAVVLLVVEVLASPPPATPPAAPGEASPGTPGPEDARGVGKEQEHGPRSARGADDSVHQPEQGRRPVE